MFTFLIISNVENISACVHKAFSAIGTPEVKGGWLFVEGEGGMNDGWIAFEPMGSVEYDFEIDELDEINRRVENPLFYLIEGRNGVVSFSNRFIQEFDPLGKVLIDNDHGMIEDLIDVKRRIKSGEDWLHSSS